MITNAELLYEYLLVLQIQKATSIISQPLVKVISGEDEGNCFWCYFCGKDVLLHTIRQTVRGEVCITNGGMLEHISGYALILYYYSLPLESCPQVILLGLPSKTLPNICGDSMP